MAHSKKRITANSKKVLTSEDRKKRLEQQTDDWGEWEYSIEDCYNAFIVGQASKGNRKETLNFYRRCHKKLRQFVEATWAGTTTKDLPIIVIANDIFIPLYRKYISNTGNIQTVNSYLRGLRAFGNFCVENGYLDYFTCTIKEEEPPIKVLYTDKEIETLLKKPDIKDFSEFRTYAIINLILNTGARCNTILNIRISDYDSDTGYISYNTTKAHKVIRLKLDRKCRIAINEWLTYWRTNKGAEEQDFLFCNEYGEQLSRSGLTKAMRIYCHSRGVDKTSLHLMRHTFAYKWIISGGDIISLAKVLTHSELDMVKRYANLYDSDISNELMEHSALSQTKTKSGETLKTRKTKITDI